MKIAVKHQNLTSVVDNDQTVVSLQELDTVENASCISVHLADCADYVPLSERAKLIKKAIGKLRYGGEITISGTDLISVGQQIMSGNMSTARSNVVLFGGRLSADTINDVIKNIQAAGLNIVNAKLVDELYYSIKARRPDVK